MTLTTGVLALALMLVGLTLDCGTPSRPSTVTVNTTTIIQTTTPTPPRRCRMRLPVIGPTKEP